MKMGFDEDIRFGIKEKRANSEVKIYKLSPEEHMQYWDKTTVVLNEVRRLAREALLTPKEIAKETGADYEKVKKICHYERYVKGRPKLKRWV